MSNVETKSPLLITGLQALEMARWMMTKLIESTPDEIFFTAPCPKGNHAGWIVGHIATTDDWFRTTLSGGEPILPKNWSELFGMNCEVSEDASKYPSRAELTSKMAETRAALIEWASGLSDAELIEPLEGDIAQFAKSRAHMLSSIAFHEGMHAGQVSVARRAQGIPPLF